jgi:sugar phosphate isomerase/epimerase
MATSSLSRRTFLGLSGALPFLLRPLSAEQRQFPAGIELYSVRDFLTKDLHGTVRSVAKLGYQEVEFYSPYYNWTTEQATEMRKLLDDLGIRCPSTHNGANALSPNGIQKAIDLNQILGSRMIVVASAGKIVGADGWKQFGERMTAGSERLRPLGMVAGFHNHQTEWRPVDGQRPMDIIAASTPKDFVLQFDVGTAVEVGVDPVAWIKAHPGRIRSMHCKDWAPAPRGYEVIFGEGVVPWREIFQAAEAVGGIEHYLIEQEAGPADEQMRRAEQCLANWKKLRG